MPGQVDGRLAMRAMHGVEVVSTPFLLQFQVMRFSPDGASSLAQGGTQRGDASACHGKQDGCRISLLLSHRQHNTIAAIVQVSNGTNGNRSSV